MANSPNTANERGAWASGTAYAASDVVDYDGFKYECIATCTGVDPAGDNGTYWVVVSSEQPAPDAVGTTVVLNEAAYTARFGDTIFATANTTITLPAPQEGQPRVKVVSNGASITATVAAPAGGSTVNGTTSVTVTTQYTAKTFETDGFNWFTA